MRRAQRKSNDSTNNPSGIIQKPRTGRTPKIPPNNNNTPTLMRTKKGIDLNGRKIRFKRLWLGKGGGSLVQLMSIIHARNHNRYLPSCVWILLSSGKIFHAI